MATVVAATVVAAPQPPLRLSRFFALIQVLLVCGIPTQIVVFIVLWFAGKVDLSNGVNIPIELFALLSLFDTALVALLIRIFLGLSGETSREMFLGSRRSWREVLIGLALLPVSFLAVQLIVSALRYLLPKLHNTIDNPFEAYLRSPLDATIFVVVVVLAGGVREELARAFILKRFEQRLGGAYLGLTLFTIAFGAMHLSQQGYDAAIGIGLLGLFWGLLYLKRRSAVASMVNHAGFDAAQVIIQYFAK